MKKLAILLALISTSALADDKNVGYCGAYHLMTGNSGYVSRVMLKAKDKQQVQRFARELVDRAHTDPNGASKRGAMACIALGLKA